MISLQLPTPTIIAIIGDADRLALAPMDRWSGGWVDRTRNSSSDRPFGLV
jgi:hypothetical protein